MIRAIIVAPEILLPKAREIFMSALGEGWGQFGYQIWADATGTNYGVAAGLFDKGVPEKLNNAAVQANIAFAILDPESAYAADPARILLLVSNKPLEAIQRMGLVPVESKITGP